jgi:DNA-binding NtrC family response regulator
MHPQPQAHDDRPGRVLIAEDEFLIAAVIEQALVAAGFVVAARAASVAGALEALEALDGTTVDVAVIDSTLRDESAARLAAVLSQRGTPFVVVTGRNRAELAKPLAAARFLAKPFTAAALVAEVRRAAGETSAEATSTEEK